MTRSCRIAGVSLAAAAALTLAMAPPCAAAVVISTTTISSAFHSASHFYSHFASGHYWVAFNNGTQPVLYSSRDAVTWNLQGGIFAFSVADSTNRWAMRYKGNQVIALAFNGADSTRYYRYGTLAADGMVSWTAAAPLGPADASDPDLNALIANGRPVMWRAGVTGNGAFWRGSELTSPVWAQLPGTVPAYGLSSGFSAGAILPTAGADPDDLVVLRAFTQTSLVAGSHRLLALKWNDALGAYDGSWYNVSTLGGMLAEDNTTEVQVNDENNIQRKFTAVADSSGNIHALYVNRNGARVTHYRKAAGFNDSWSLVTNDLLSGGGAAKIAVSAAPNGHLLLFYEKNTAQQDVWYRRFDGSSWGGETLLYPGASLGQDLRQGMAPLELVAGCAGGVGFSGGGGTPPFDVRFAVTADCPSLTTSEDTGAGTITVTAPAAFEMVFTTAAGGSMEQLYDLAEDPGKTLDLAGSLGTSTSPRGLHNFGMQVGAGSFFNSGANDQGARLHLIEATPARVRLRQDAFYQNAPGGPILGGVKGYGDYSVYLKGKLALRWDRRVTAAAGVPYITEFKEIFLHRLGSGPLNGWVPYHDAGSSFPAATGLSDFVMGQNETAGSPGARTDVLEILYQDWTTGNGYPATADVVASSVTPSAERVNIHWIESGGFTLPNGRRDTWDSLTYVKPTGFVDHADAAVTSRSADYRSPAVIYNVSAGSRWADADENTPSADPDDFFNEAEAAYVFDLDPVNGLSFDIDAAATPRYSPFFKIRKWRSTQALLTASMEGAPLAADVDYKAAVMPVARAHFADDILWYSTLQDGTAVTSPSVGTGGTVTGPTAVAGRFGQGFLFDANNEEIAVISAGDFDHEQGAVEFWFQPRYDHTDNLIHRLWGYRLSSSFQFMVSKTGTNQLRFQIANGGSDPLYTVPSTGYSWHTGDWVHLRFTWDKDAALGQQLRIFMNGAALATNNNGVLYAPNPLDWPNGTLRIGSDSNGNDPASGVIDEFYVYSSPVAPGPTGATPDPSGRSGLAHGGLTSDAREFLADGSAGRNFSFGFGLVDGSRRGEYVYFGADSKFHGLNVVLSAAGSGTAPDLQWQYWQETTGTWASLETGGFVDETSGFTRNGTVRWNTDPGGWRRYSVNGGPELYYVRAYLASGDYSVQAPVESVIKTDILLFQYCQDVTLNSQDFVLAPPVTTEVTLLSFTAAAADGAVTLEWRTASELRNLGFHLYRSLSEQGPWTRLTSSLIPGLGSSAVGQAYTFQDGGLANGTRYHYRLEDVDASSKTTSHGPVSAVPGADASAGAGGGGRDARREAGPQGPGSASCPAWVLLAYGSTAGSAPAAARCTRHGDPEASDLAVLSRDARSLTLELRTGGFYALHEAAGRVRVFVPGFDLPQDGRAAALPFRRVLAPAVVGRRVQLAGVRALDSVGFRGLVPAAIGEAEMRIGRDGTVRAARRGARELAVRSSRPELVRLLPSLFQGEEKHAVVEIAPLRFDAGRRQLVLAKRVRVRLLFTGREAGESGRGSVGRKARSRSGQPAAPSGELLARLFTSSRGLYAVTFEQLLPSRRRDVAVSELRLARQGEAVAFQVEPATGRFGPGSRLLFFAERGAGSSAFTAELAHELSHSAGGVRMAPVAASPAGPELGLPSTAFTAFETNRFYQPGLLAAPDLWLWEALVSGATRALPFALSGVTGAGTAELQVQLQGASESGSPVDHHVSVSLNGSFVGEARFAGKRPHRASLSLPASLLREGANELRLTNVGDTGVASLVFLDRFSLAYPQASRLAGGAFEGTWAETGTATLAGLTGPVALLDVTAAAAGAAPSGPGWLTGWQAAAAGTLRFQALAGRRYLVVCEPLVPRVAAPEPSTLRAATNQADYLLIAPRGFLAAAAPLLERRAGQGLVARGVAFEEIAAEFGHGQASAEAIRDFLAHAYHSWTPPSPRHVLLLGDASYDPRNFMGSSQPSPLPALWTRTSYLWTVSDPLLAAVNGDDDVPDLAIGRLPATTLEQAETLVGKLIAWEDSGQGLSGAAALVADNPDLAGDFEADVRDIARSYLAERNPQLLLLSQLGSALRPRIQDALDAGLSHLNYVGHGGAAVWASENVWNSWDTASLRAQSRQPLLVTMNCLNGYFVAPAFESLAESLLKAEGRGAIAAFAPSGLSVNGPAHQYHRALMAELVSGRHERLGEAVLAAQKTYAASGLMPELLGIYQLLGDPATRLR